MDNRRNLNLFFAIFIASGFSGLIYESIWTQYLKLFLGHAAYAQTLVLAVFMGGMALGSLFCSKYTGRLRNVLMGYAVAELAIGICSIFFHPLYVRFLDITYDHIIPALGSSFAVTAFKWIGASFLILPQSILLGMTFPLMAAGLIRRFPRAPGSIIATLYFTNSLGAAVGVLTAGFLFIGWAGLPGTLVIAGFINIVVSAAVWMLERNNDAAQPLSVRPAEPPRSTAPRSFFYKIFLTIALLTGLSSFIYEVGWIRMLSLVLGSSTHAFELMLSAFILGIAFGGYWIKGRIDSIDDPRRLLALVQIAMGMLALATLPFYNNTFSVMARLIKHLPKTEEGYLLFNISSHGIAMAIMLPAAFCAGMTLPLLTTTLLREGNDERSIGAIYGFNTIGSILGVFIAIHAAMPILGLKGMIILGAGIDIVLGLFLLWWLAPKQRIVVWYTAASSISLLATALFVKFDANKMASGVFRTPAASYRAGKEETIFQKDGKTASVSITKYEQTLSIKTNGKSDAGIMMTDRGHTLDEETMILLGAIGPVLRPASRTAAVIGWGSGLTTHTLLTDPQIESVDTIEIEPVMVKAARLFGSHVHLAYDDPRSHLHIDDAKSFFSSQDKRYDLIISEPSNPWVSGVASLFTNEFYSRIRHYLKKDGLFIQWVQLYEIDKPLLASIMNAISLNFSDYVIYDINSVDILIVACPSGTVSKPDPTFLSMRPLMTQLGRIDVTDISDINARVVGSKKILAPFFESYPITTNSDYAPVVDLFAVKSRFLLAQSRSLFSDLETNRLPIVQMLGERSFELTADRVKFAAYPRTQMIHFADVFYHYVMSGQWHLTVSSMSVQDKARKDAELSRKMLLNACSGGISNQDWWQAMHIIVRVLPLLSTHELNTLLQKVEFSPCARFYSTYQRNFISLLKAVGKRDPKLMVRFATMLLNDTDPETIDDDQLDYALSAAMLGNLALGKTQEAGFLWRKYSHFLQIEYRQSTTNRLLLAQISDKANVLVDKKKESISR